MKNKRWTKEELGKLVEMQRRGMTHEEIGDALGRTKGSIRNQSSLLKPKKRKYNKKTWKHYEGGNNPVSKNRKHQRWTKKEHATLIQMLKVGYSLPRMSRELGRTKRSIESRISIYRMRSGKIKLPVKENTNQTDDLQSIVDKVTELKAENERLRAAIESIRKVIE